MFVFLQIFFDRRRLEVKIFRKNCEQRQRETERQRERERQTERLRQRQRETERQREKKNSSLNVKRESFTKNGYELNAFYASHA